MDPIDLVVEERAVFLDFFGVTDLSNIIVQELLVSKDVDDIKDGK